MNFKCWDLKSKKLVYEYNDQNDNHQCGFVNNFDHEVTKIKCGENRFFISHIEQNLIFAFCIDKVTNSKPATRLIKQATRMYFTMNPIIEDRQLEYENIVKTSVHNTKNLNSQITSKLLRQLNESSLSNSKDKTLYIEDLIKYNTFQFAKEILSILKLSSQISSEYNVIDYIKPNIIIPKSEYSYGKIHNLLVLAFYNYEHDFDSNKISVNINSTLESAYSNFNTTQTVFNHILSNALRYCKEKSQINITTKVIDDDYVEIDFNMISLYLNDNIIDRGLISGERDDQAKRLVPKGTGLGLGIIKKLAELNRGSFDFGRINDEKIEYNGYVYGNNSCRLRLLRFEFYT